MMEVSSFKSKSHLFESKNQYTGLNPLQALENIKIRCQQRKQKKKSNLKTALVLQGGGMRGVFGAGVCCALEELGYTEGFDQIYGVSAGALNAAYFLSGQAAFGTTIYYQNINNRRFINLFRWKKIVDIDFLMKIVTKEKPLNIEKLLSSSTTLNIVLTCVASGKPVIFNHKDAGKDILKILKGTAALPFLYDIPVEIDGRKFLDGGISCPIPVVETIEDGCTDIFVVLTRHEYYQPSPPRGIWENFLVKPVIKKHGENLYNLYTTSYHNYKERMLIATGKKLYGERKVNIITIFPDPEIGITRLTKNKDTLKKAATDGAIKTFNLFGVKNIHPAEVLKFLNY